MRRERLTWDEVDMLIDHLLPQFDHEFDGMVIITRGGIIPGGLLAAALQIEHILTAAVDFSRGSGIEHCPAKQPLLSLAEIPAISRR